MTTTMQAAQISKPGGEWEVVERVLPEPRAGQVRVKVEACGMCHSDVFVKEGRWLGLFRSRLNRASPGLAPARCVCRFRCPQLVASYLSAVSACICTMSVHDESRQNR